MLEIQGTFNTAKVYTNSLDNGSLSQIQAFLNNRITEGSKVCFMPDVHAGKGCVVGTTMTLTDKVCPNIVGVDIGCGMLVVRLKETKVDLPKLDSVIRKYIPAGLDKIQDEPLSLAENTNLQDLLCGIKDLNKAKRAIGSLGGGNHFIEIDKDSNNHLYLVIHTGSRNIGCQVAIKWQNIAYQQIQKSEFKDTVPYELSYLCGKELNGYLHDMRIAQEFADLNRQAIANIVLKKMKLHSVDQFTTVHNYIDLWDNIIRKGAVSAHGGERLIIPMNMRDGSLLCIGRGESDWNFSAPHGAGRLLSRLDAKNTVSVSEYKESMKGIYSTCIGKDTVDESPQVYKPMEEIIGLINDTVEITDVIKPIYNFKAS